MIKTSAVDLLSCTNKAIVSHPSSTIVHHEDIEIKICKLDAQIKKLKKKNCNASATSFACQIFCTKSTNIKFVNPARRNANQLIVELPRH